MSGTAQNANKGPVDALLWTQGSSLFFPKQWQTVANFYWDVSAYSPNTISSWGGLSTWLIPNNVCTYFGKVSVKARATAAVSTYASAAYDDFAGYSWWAYAFMQYGSNKIDYLGSEFTKFKFYDEQMTLFKRQAIQPYIQGPLPLAQRQLNLINGCEIIVELPFWCTRGYGSAMPLVMGTDMQFGIQWREFPEVIYTVPGDTGAITTVPTLVDQTLYIQQMHGAPNEQGELFNHAMAGIMQLMDRQIVTESRATQPLAAFATETYNVPTPNVNIPTSYQNVVVRTVDQINTPYRVSRWIMRGGLNDPDLRIRNCYWVTTSGNIRNPISIGVVKPYQSSWFRDNPGLSDPQVQMDVSMQPLLAGTSFGALNTSNLAGYAVYVTIASISANSLTPFISIFSTVKNAQKYIQGNVYPIFQ